MELMGSSENEFISRDFLTSMLKAHPLTFNFQHNIEQEESEKQTNHKECGVNTKCLDVYKTEILISYNSQVLRSRQEI